MAVVISSISPSTVNYGDNVTVTGTGFTTGTCSNVLEVADSLLGWVSQAIVSWTATQIVFTVGATLELGLHSIRADDDNDNYGSLADCLTIVAVGSACNDGTTLQPSTVLDIIKRALRLLGVVATGETPDAPEIADCLQVLNWMLDQWTTEKLMIYYMLNETFSITATKGTYTIGADATKDFNTARPERIESAFCRDSSSGYNNDYKLEIIPNDRYQDIFQKGIQSTYPKYLHYVPSWPYGSIDIWPIPTKNYILGLSQTKQFGKYLLSSDIVCLPPGYKHALGYSLAVEMAPEYNVEQGKLAQLQSKALEMKANLKRINYEPVLMSTDSVLIPRRMYNIYSDRY